MTEHSMYLTPLCYCFCSCWNDDTHSYSWIIVAPIVLSVLVSVYVFLKDVNLTGS